MPIEFVAAAAANGNANPMTVPVPAGTGVGDVVLLTQIRYQTSFATIPANATPLSPTFPNSPAGTQGQCYRKVDGSEGSVFTFTNINSWATILLAETFRGVDLTAPIDGSPSFVLSTTKTHNAPSLTPANAGDMLVCHFANWFVQPYITVPAGMTKSIERADGGNLGAMGAYQLLGAAGVASGVKGATVEYTGNGTGGSILLKAAGGGGPSPGRRLLLGAS